jgi:hypothetical protein
MTLTRNGPAADGAAVRAGDRDYAGQRPDTATAPPAQLISNDLWRRVGELVEIVIARLAPGG